MKRSYPSYMVETQNTPFPQGVYVGEIAEVRPEQWNEEKTRMQTLVFFGDNQPIEGDGRPVGKRRHIERFPIIWDGQSVVDLQKLDDDSVPFPLRRSASLLIQLAAALKFGEKSGGSYVVDLDGFLEALPTLEGCKVGFEVAWRKDRNSDRQFAETRRFFRVADDESEEPEDEEELELEEEEEEEEEEQPPPPPRKTLGKIPAPKSARSRP